VREGAFIGTPVVNIGSRQDGRRRARNVLDVPHGKSPVFEAIKQQLDHGRYERDPIYGDGKAGDRIADVLATKTDIQIQKRITY
jgi:UDP-N-acetylglucosamine 2-epimerase